MLIAYGMRAVLVLTSLLLAVLIFCGCLYLREHLFPAEPDQSLGGTADGGDQLEDPGENQDQTAGNRSGGSLGIEPSRPTAPGENLPAVVAIDPGHGGVQSGCEFDGVLEKDITLPVALEVKKLLESAGITVVMTREDDEDVDLEERCRIANAARADLFVSIHCNSYTEDTSISGFEGYYYQDADGKTLADRILAAAEEHSVKTRNVKEENYLVLRETDMPAALMEIGYLSNAGERERLQSAEYQGTIAQAIADGIMDMLER